MHGSCLTVTLRDYPSPPYELEEFSAGHSSWILDKSYKDSYVFESGNQENVNTWYYSMSFTYRIRHYINMQKLRYNLYRIRYRSASNAC